MSLPVNHLNGNWLQHRPLMSLFPIAYFLLWPGKLPTDDLERCVQIPKSLGQNLISQKFSATWHNLENPHIWIVRESVKNIHFSLQMNTQTLSTIRMREEMIKENNKFIRKKLCQNSIPFLLVLHTEQLVQLFE